MQPPRRHRETPAEPVSLLAFLLFFPPFIIGLGIIVYEVFVNHAEKDKVLWLGVGLALFGAGGLDFVRTGRSLGNVFRAGKRR